MWFVCLPELFVSCRQEDYRHACAVWELVGWEKLRIAATWARVREQEPEVCDELSCRNVIARNCCQDTMQTVVRRVRDGAM